MAFYLLLTFFYSSYFLFDKKSEQESIVVKAPVPVHSEILKRVFPLSAPPGRRQEGRGWAAETRQRTGLPACLPACVTA